MKLHDFKVVRISDTKIGTVYAICPFCADTKGHAEVDKVKNVWHCHRCHRGGRLATGNSQSKEKVAMRELSINWDDYLHSISPQGLHARYLERRGFGPIQLKHLDPRYGPSSSKVYFLVRDDGGYFRYVVGREITATSQPKWWFPKGTPGKSHFLWHTPGFSFSPGGHIVIVEGIFDAVWGINRVACFGTSLSSCQLNLILGWDPKEITIFLDSDAAVKAEEMALHIFQKHTLRIYICVPPWGQDPENVGAYGNEFLFDTRRRVFG